MLPEDEFGGSVIFFKVYSEGKCCLSGGLCLAASKNI